MTEPIRLNEADIQMAYEMFAASSASAKSSRHISATLTPDDEP